MNSRPLVIYHGNCADGFTAAWVANMAYNGFQQTDKWHVDAVPGIYGEPPPDCTGRFVYILDFSYPPEVIDAMAAQADRIVWIDHHETAIKREAGHTRPNVEKHFDISKSGALLTALYFEPNVDPYDIVSLVSDRDLWQFKDKRSRPFAAGLFSRFYTLGDWNYAASNIQETINDGAAIERKHLKDIEELIGVSARWELIGGVEVPVVNLPYTMASDACAKLLEMHPEAPFAASWYLRKDGKRVYSLRSRPWGANVAEVAERYGGGGHANASGFAAYV